MDKYNHLQDENQTYYCLVDLLRHAHFCNMDKFLQFLLGKLSRVNLRRNDYMAFLYMACFLFESCLYAYWFLHSSSVCIFWFLFAFNSWARFCSCLCSFRRIFFFPKYKCRFVTYVHILWPFSIPLPVWVFPKQVCLEKSSSALRAAWNALRVSLSSFLRVNYY